jgi:hypothetical protein
MDGLGEREGREGDQYRDELGRIRDPWSDKGGTVKDDGAAMESSDERLRVCDVAIDDFQSIGGW